MLYRDTANTEPRAHSTVRPSELHGKCDCRAEAAFSGVLSVERFVAAPWVTGILSNRMFSNVRRASAE